MTPYDGLGRGTMPALRSTGGRTRLAFGFPDGDAPEGVRVVEFPDGRPKEARRIFEHRGPFRGDPDLSPDGQHVGYFDGADRLRVVHVASGAVVLSLPLAAGVHPIRLRDDAAVYQTAVDPTHPGLHPADGVYEWAFEVATPRRLGPYGGSMGLAYLTPGGYVTTDDNRASLPGLLNPARAGDCVVAQRAGRDAVVVRIGSRQAALWDGELWNDPTVCQQADGAYTVAVWRPAVALRVVAGVTAADLEGAEPAPMGDVMIPAFERPLWMAPFFSHSEKYGDTPLERHVGNAIVLVERESDPSVLPRELQRVAALNKPLIVQGDTQPMPDDSRIVAWWATAAGVDELGARVARALEQPERPVIAYLDRDEWPSTKPGGLDLDRVWPSVPLYRRAGEALTTFRDRGRAQLARVASYGGSVVLTPRFDDPDQDGSVWSLADTLECMPIYEQWIRDFPVAAVMPFADRRGHGIAKYDELWRWARAFQFAIPSERPNRFDYWRPRGASDATILRNKLGQTRASIVLEPALRRRILEAINETPTPGPTPPSPGEWPDLLPDLQAERAKYPQDVFRPDEVDTVVAILNAVAWRHRDQGFGLLAKSGGNRGRQPRTGIECSVDWLVSRTHGRGLDCLGDAPNVDTGDSGPATPIWSEGEPFDVSRWIAPVEP